MPYSVEMKWRLMKLVLALEVAVTSIVCNIRSALTNHSTGRNSLASAESDAAAAGDRANWSSAHQSGGPNVKSAKNRTTACGVAPNRTVAVRIMQQPA